MQLEIIANAGAIYARKWTLREQKNAAETVEEPDAVDMMFEAEMESGHGWTSWTNPDCTRSARHYQIGERNIQ